jgi:hypothetical protein
MRMTELALLTEGKRMTIERYEAPVMWRRHEAVLSVDRTESFWCWRMSERDSPIQVGGSQATLDEAKRKVVDCWKRSVRAPDGTAVSWRRG